MPFRMRRPMIWPAIWTIEAKARCFRHAVWPIFRPVHRAVVIIRWSGRQTLGQEIREHAYSPGHAPGRWKNGVYVQAGGPFVPLIFVQHRYERSCCQSFVNQKIGCQDDPEPRNRRLADEFSTVAERPERYMHLPRLQVAVAVMPNVDVRYPVVAYAVMMRQFVRCLRCTKTRQIVRAGAD